MDQEERREFVAKHRTAVFGFGRKSHGPAMSIVYYVMDDGDILVSTMAERGKAKAVARNPKVSPRLSRRAGAADVPARVRRRSDRDGSRRSDGSQHADRRRDGGRADAGGRAASRA